MSDDDILEAVLHELIKLKRRVRRLERGDKAVNAIEEFSRVVGYDVRNPPKGRAFHPGYTALHGGAD